MKTVNLFLIVFVISIFNLPAQVTLTHNNTYHISVNTMRPEISVNNNEYYVAVVQASMNMPNPVGTKKHYVHHYDANWSKIDSFPVTTIDTAYGEPVDHRMMIINGEIVLVYQSVIWKDTSLWIYNSNPLDQQNSINQSLMLARFSLSGTELFKGPIVLKDTNHSHTFSDLAIAWNGTDLLVSTGTYPPPNPQITIRKINISNGSIVNTYSYNTSTSTIPSPFGNSILLLNNHIKVFGSTPPNGTNDLTVSDLDSNYVITAVNSCHDVTNEQTYPTGSIFYDNYYFIAHDERVRGGPVDVFLNPYFPYLRILDDQFNTINNISVGDTGMMHIHPVILINDGKLFYGWSKKNTNGSSSTPQVFVEEYLLTISDIQANENEIISIEIFPNPAKDMVYINFTDNQNMKMQVYDIIGKCILQEVLYNSTNEIDISPLPKGVYIIELMGTDHTIRHKLIKE